MPPGRPPHSTAGSRSPFIPAHRLERILAAVAAQPADMPVLERLVRVATELLGADDAAVLVLRPGGDTQVFAAGGDGAAPLAELQFQVGVGPALDAHETGDIVESVDLGGGADQRWPALAARVGDGVHAVLAVPVRVGAVRLGVLAVHRARPWPWTEGERLDGTALADLVASAVLDQMAGVTADELVSLPQHAVVHQATGMLAAQLDVDISAALARLRARAFLDDRPLYDVSVDVVTRIIRLVP